MAEVKIRQKYDLGAAVDKELVFDFPYILHEGTVSYIQNHGKVMFIIRGPPSTGKATLSEMLQDRYPDAAFCCADEYFQNSFDSPVRNKLTIKSSHDYCRKKATSACKNNVSTIIIQNTHMKKWEMQPYLDLAAQYGYTVIMAITLYRFNVTPEALYANSTDGLDIGYFRRRLLQWEDNPPYLTGWFLGPSDSTFLQHAALRSLKKLINDGKFCRVFDLYDSEQVEKYFRFKNLLYCLAGHSPNLSSMTDYYLSPHVQDAYGKCFKITILGYHVTLSSLNAVVKVNAEMKPLVFRNAKARSVSLCDQLNHLQVSLDNFFAFGKASEFVPKPAENYTAYTEDWSEDEEIDTLECSFIRLGKRGILLDSSNSDGDIFNIETMREEFEKSLHSAGDNNKINDSSYTELESDTKVCRLEGNEWLIKADKKIVIETIFTGFYP